MGRGRKGDEEKGVDRDIDRGIGRVIDKLKVKTSASVNREVA